MVSHYAIRPNAVLYALCSHINNPEPNRKKPLNLLGRMCIQCKLTNKD